MWNHLNFVPWSSATLFLRMEASGIATSLMKIYKVPLILLHRSESELLKGSKRIGLESLANSCRAWPGYAPISRHCQYPFLFWALYKVVGQLLIYNSSFRFQYIYIRWVHTPICVKFFPWIGFKLPHSQNYRFFMNSNPQTRLLSITDDRR